MLYKAEKMPPTSFCFLKVLARTLWFLEMMELPELNTATILFGTSQAVQGPKGTYGSSLLEPTIRMIGLQTTDL